MEGSMAMEGMESEVGCQGAQDVEGAIKHALEMVGGGDLHSCQLFRFRCRDKPHPVIVLHNRRPHLSINYQLTIVLARLNGRDNNRKVVGLVGTGTSS